MSWVSGDVISLLGQEIEISLFVFMKKIIDFLPIDLNRAFNRTIASLAPLKRQMQDRLHIDVKLGNLCNPSLLRKSIVSVLKLFKRSGWQEWDFSLKPYTAFRKNLAEGILDLRTKDIFCLWIKTIMKQFKVWGS